MSVTNSNPHFYAQLHSFIFTKMTILGQSRLPLLRSVFISQNCIGKLFYHSSSLSRHSLYRRISPLGDPNVSLVPILDEWVQQGNPVTQTELQLIIRELRVCRRFKQALQVSFHFLLFSFLFFFNILVLICLLKQMSECK